MNINQKPGDERRQSVKTGLTPSGLRFAFWSGWRIVAYANGGYQRTMSDSRRWVLIPDYIDFPEDVEALLCEALQITMKPR